MVVAGVYLVGGFIYQRFVAGAKGLEQIPNYGFWRDFGNLQAVGKINSRVGNVFSAPSVRRTFEPVTHP